MPLDEEPLSLSGVELFAPLSGEEVRNLARQIPDVCLDRGQIFYTPWHRGENLFLLLEGRIRTYRVKQAREITTNVIYPGDLFGEANLAGLRQGSYAQALSPSRIALVRRQALQRMVADKPELGMMMIELLAGRLSVYEDKLEEVGLKEIPSRLACLLARMVEAEGVKDAGGYWLPTHYTHQILATMIGCERPALTRALGDLKQSGIVCLSGRHIHVTDLKALKRYAEEA